MSHEELGVSFVVRRVVIGFKLKDAFLRFREGAHLVQVRLAANLIFLALNLTN